VPIHHHYAQSCIEAAWWQEHRCWLVLQIYIRIAFLYPIPFLKIISLGRKHCVKTYIQTMPGDKLMQIAKHYQVYPFLYESARLRIIN